MSDKDRKDLEEFNLLKESGYSALKKLNEQYEKRAEQLAEIERAIVHEQKELEKLQRAVLGYNKLI